VRAHDRPRGSQPDDPAPDNEHIDTLHPAARYSLCEKRLEARRVSPILPRSRDRDDNAWNRHDEVTPRSTNDYPAW
jgi:hypothetical protein